jgi:hypothetical protein
VLQLLQEVLDFQKVQLDLLDQQVLNFLLILEVPEVQTVLEGLVVQKHQELRAVQGNQEGLLVLQVQ